MVKTRSWPHSPSLVLLSESRATSESASALPCPRHSSRRDRLARRQTQERHLTKQSLLEAVARRSDRDGDGRASQVDGVREVVTAPHLNVPTAANNKDLTARALLARVLLPPREASQAVTGRGGLRHSQATWT